MVFGCFTEISSFEEVFEFSFGLSWRGERKLSECFVVEVNADTVLNEFKFSYKVDINGYIWLAFIKHKGSPLCTPHRVPWLPPRLPARCVFAFGT